MDLGIERQKAELFADIPSHRNSLLHVGWGPQPVLLAKGCSSTECDYSHSHVHVFSDQNHLTKDRDQVGKIPHQSPNRTILYGNFLQFWGLDYGREM